MAESFCLKIGQFSSAIPLLHLRSSVVECAFDLGANAGESGDASNGDQGSNQTIFNGGRTLGVADKILEIGHVFTPFLMVPTR